MSDNAVRKWWLSISISAVLFDFFYLIGLFLFIKSDPFFSDVAKEALVLSIMSFCFSFIMFEMFYNCAYKKPGTTLLSITLCFIVIYLPYDFYTMAKDHGEVIKTVNFLSEFELPASEGLVSGVSAMESIGFVQSVFSLLFTVAWSIFSFLLYKVNKRRQVTDILAIPEYRVVLDKMHSAKSEESLREIFGEGVRLHPRINWYLKKTYKKLKGQIGSVEMNSENA